jgi:hypothetical protein
MADTARTGFAPRIRRALGAAAAALLPALAAGGAAAQEPARLHVELNKLEPAAEACRAFFVVENRTPADLASLNLDLVVFDADGVVARRLAAQMGPVGAGKTRLRVFALDGMACAQAGRLLLNGVLDCAGPAEGGATCADRLVLSSRAAAPFGD